MAVRLNVVMIQSPPPTATAQQITEGVIGELIGRPGIDLTLVAGLTQLGEASTDRLSIESLTGDVAVLDWQSPEAIVEALTAFGTPGQRSPHPGDPEAPRPTDATRRVYAFDLRGFQTASAVCESVDALLASRQTRTFTLGGLSPPPPTPAASGLERLSGRRQRSPQQAETHHSVDAREPPSEAASAAPRSAPPVGEGRQASSSSVDLDELVDRLDELDP